MASEEYEKLSASSTKLNGLAYNPLQPKEWYTQRWSVRREILSFTKARQDSQAVQ